jgi:hypothetical protein
MEIKEALSVWEEDLKIVYTITREKETDRTMLWMASSMNTKEKKSWYLKKQENCHVCHILQSTHPMQHLLDLSKIRYIWHYLAYWLWVFLGRQKIHVGNCIFQKYHLNIGKYLPNKFTIFSKIYKKTFRKLFEYRKISFSIICFRW